MRLLKQFLYGFFYFSIFFGSLYIVFLLTFPPSPADQRLEEIRALSPLITLQTVFFINQAEGTIDLGAEIRNPNFDWGVRRFDYHFILKDAAEVELSRASGSNFILPGETRWVILPGGGRAFPLVPLPRDGIVSVVGFEIQPINPNSWQRARPFGADVSVITKNLRYEEATRPRVGTELRGEVENRSSFSLGEVEINGVIFGPGNRVLAVGRTLTRGLGPGESRAFTIHWPNQLPVGAVRWEAWGHANFLMMTRE